MSTALKKMSTQALARLKSYWDAGDGPRTSTWASRYLQLALVAFVFAFITIWITSSYFAVSPTELTSLHLRDLHCEASQAVSKVHCFSDFSIVREIFDRADPWNAGKVSTSYPPIAWAPALTAATIGDSFLGGGHAGTLLYLFIAGICLLIPGLWAAKGRWRTDGLLVVLLTSIGAAPALSLLDRGNNVAFAIPFLLVTAVGYQRQDSRLLFIGIVGAALLKPQMIVLAALPLAQRQYRVAFGSAITAGVVTLLSFAAFPAHFPKNVLGWLHTMMAYNNYQEPGVGYPYNLSVGRSVVTVADSFFGGVMSAEFRGGLLHIVDKGGFIAVLGCLALSMAVLWFTAQKVPRIYSLALAFLMVILSSSVVSVYYTALLIVIAALILRDPNAEPRFSERFGVLDASPQVGRLAPYVIIIVTALILAPVILPTEIPAFVTGYHAKLTGRVVSLYQLWLGPLLLALFVFLVAYTPLLARRLARDPSSDPGEQ